MARTPGTAYKADVATGSATTITIPDGSGVATVTAGDFGVVTWRYEGGTDVVTSVTDSAGGTWYIIGEANNAGFNVNAGLAYTFNHPGGTNVVVTVTLSSGRIYRMGSVRFYSGQVGELDPFDSDFDLNESLTSDPSLTLTATADGMAIMAVGFYSNATMIPTSPTEFLINPGDGTYASSFQRTYTGSGSKTIAATGGTSAGAAIAAAFLDDGGTGGDSTAPVLTSPTGTATGSTTATVGATTDEGNGTLYAFVSTSATPPSGADLKAGTGAVWAGSVAVSSTGAKTLNATGLTASTGYYAHLIHTDAAANDSNTVTSSQFTTNASGVFPPVLLRAFRPAILNH